MILMYKVVTDLPLLVIYSLFHYSEKILGMGVNPSEIQLIPLIQYQDTFVTFSVTNFGSSKLTSLTYTVTVDSTLLTVQIPDLPVTLLSQQPTNFTGTSKWNFHENSFV